MKKVKGLRNKQKKHSDTDNNMVIIVGRGMRGDRRRYVGRGGKKNKIILTEIIVATIY